MVMQPNPHRSQKGEERKLGLARQKELLLEN